MKDRYVLFWVYGDEGDSPFIIVNPPKNFNALLRKWNKMDEAFCDDPQAVPEWEPVDTWLRNQGVNIVAAKEKCLDDYR